MGVFSIPLEVGDLEQRGRAHVDAWVDTGAFYSSFARPLLESLGVAAHMRERFMLADGRVVESDIGHAWIRVAGRSVITLVLFAEPDTEPLLGAYTLEGVALAVDPVSQRLVPMPWLPRFDLLPA